MPADRQAAAAPPASGDVALWAVPVETLLARLGASAAGLTGAEAERRLTDTGPNALRPRRSAGALRTLGGQFTSPITLLLLVAAVLSVTLGEGTDGAIILGILLVS